MSTFVAVLVAYFACDGIASERLLTQEEAQRCVKSYEAVKEAFLSDKERAALSDGSVQRASALRAGYRRFCDWKLQNPEQVQKFRRLAREAVNEYSI